MKDCLLFYSGGYDSFLVASQLIELGYSVKLVSFDNGSIQCRDNLKVSVQQLQDRYGDALIQFVGWCPTWGTFMDFKRCLLNRPLHEIAVKYSNICLPQLNCLCCQTAMWCCGIAYCFAKKIDVISTGYKATDIFCTGNLHWVSSMCYLACKYDIEVILPVWTMSDDDVQRAIFDRQFNKSKVEPWCTIGYPADKMNGYAESNLNDFFTAELSERLTSSINALAQHYRVMEFDKDSAYF